MHLVPARPTCLACGAVALSLLIAIDRQGFPHGHADHNVSHSYNAVFVCQHCGYGQLEVCSHDCWSYYEDEAWDMYWWYVLAPQELVTLRRFASACSRSEDAGCGCDVHQVLLQACERLYGQTPSSTSAEGLLSAVTIRVECDDDKLLFVVATS